MADLTIPAALRQADINIWKCANKAAQLQTVKPIMAYWCEYWTVNQILAKGLHTTDDDILRYTEALVSKLEKTKAEYANEPAITDDAAGQAYVEQFAQEILDRAERVVRANKVTQQTATTFDAAATFFHVVNIWGPADQETQQKIKYAKWNAARIMKAIKEGKDPNESNPKHEAPTRPTQTETEPTEAAFQAPTRPRPVTVEEVPDIDLQRDAAGVSLPQSPVSATAASVAPSAPSVSDGELRLPQVPSDLGPPEQPGNITQEPTVFPPSHHKGSFQSTDDFPSPPSWPQPQPSSPSPLAVGNFPNMPRESSNFPSTLPVVPPLPTAPHPSSIPPPTFGYISSPPSTNYVPPTQTGAVVDEAAMVEAQKHAKYAISALNFDDVPTAIKELRRALELLGAR